MVDVSIIVPCYNVEKYLEKCLDSLCHQSLKNIQIIVVDDGSTDQTSQIIAKYAKKDQRILSLRKENGGLSDARNYAFPYVKGEYVAFVDSDDYVEEDMYEKMYRAAKNNKYDLVECDFIWEYPNKKVLDRATYDKDYFTDIRVVAWNKLFATSIIKKNKLCFIKGLRYEDIAFTYSYLPYVKRHGIVHEAFYHYIQRPESIANTQNIRVREIYDILEQTLLFYQKKGFYNQYKKELEYLFVKFLFGRHLYRVSQVTDKNSRKEILEEGWTLLHRYFPKWKENCYVIEKKGKKNFFYRHMNHRLYSFSAFLLSIIGKYIF